MNPDQLFAALNELGTKGIPGPQICQGTVGWEEDADHFDLGDQTNDGHTLVKVQLYDGRDITKPLNATVGQGRKILCQLATNIFEIPPTGTRVFVAMPNTNSTTPGGGVIFAAVEKDHRYNLTDGSVQVTTRDGSSQVVVRPDGSVTLFTSDDNTDNGKSVYFRVKKDGFVWCAPWGTIRFDESGFHVLHQSGAAFDLGGIGGLPGPLSSMGSYAKASAAMIDLEGSAVSAGSTGLPLADATALLAIIAQLVGLLTMIGTTFSAFSATTITPVTGTALGAAGAAINTAVGAMVSTLAPLLLQVPK